MMTGNGRELADMMQRGKGDVLCMQETRWTGSEAKSIRAEFELYHHGADRNRNGVGVILVEE